MAPERYSSSCPARARKYVRGDTDDRDPPALAARAVFAVIVYSSGAGPEAGESYRCRVPNGPAAPARRGRGRLDRAGVPRAGRGPVTGRADDGERARNRELRLPRGTEPNGTEQNRTACGRTPPPRRRRRSGQIQRRVSISHRHHHPLTNGRKNAEHAWSKKKATHLSFVFHQGGKIHADLHTHTPIPYNFCT